MRGRKLAVAALFGAVLLLLLSSAVPAQAAHGDTSGLYGGTLRVAVRSALDLNPFTATDAESWKVIPLVYDSLGRIDPVSLRPVPWAAESWSISGSDIVVTLRSDLWFHDGSPVTAADVVYTYTEARAAGRVPSDTTVSGSGNTVTLSSATGGGLLFGQGLMFPIVKSGTVANPVGSGPWIRGASTANTWTLVANANHFWPPYLETLTFTVYPDTASAAADLLRGNLDFIGWTLLVDEPGALIDVDGVTKTLLADASIVQNPGLQQLVVGFNTESTRPTSDDALRIALAETLNPILYRQIYPSTVISRSPVIQENIPWYNPNVPVYQVTVNAFPRSSALLTESLQLLDAAGYLDRDGDGIREAPDGAPLTLTVVGLPVEEDARQFTILEATNDVFTRLGLNAVVEAEPPATIEARLDAGDYDVFVYRIDTILDPGFLWDYVHSSGALNWFNFTDAGVDTLVAAANAAVDSASRKAAVDAIQIEVMNRGFFVPVLHFNAIEATVRGGFDGWVNMPGGVNNFWSYQRVHVPQLGSLQLDVTLVPNSVRSGGTTTAIARVLDQDGAPVAAATVSFWIGGAQVATGTTDGTGTVSRSITAPSVGGATDVHIVVRASKLGFAGATSAAAMTVTPDLQPLSVSVVSSAVTIPSGGQATITVTVTSGGSAVPNARVSLEVVGLGGGVAQASGTTNAQGQFTTTFTGDVGPRTQFRIVATASAAGFTESSGSTSVVVEQRVGAIEPRIAPGLDWAVIIAAVIALVVIAALAAMMGRRK